MPWGSVTLAGPADRDVYVNSNYEDIAGKTNEDFAVEYGLNTFETLDDQFRIDFRAEAEVNDETPHVDTELEAVDPPEPTVLTPPGAAGDGRTGCPRRGLARSKGRRARLVGRLGAHRCGACRLQLSDAQ